MWADADDGPSMWKILLALVGFTVAGTSGHLAYFPLPEGADGVVGLGAVLFYIPAIAIAGYLIGLGAGALLDRQRDPGHWRRDRVGLVVSIFFAAGAYVIYLQFA
jgi:predicted membrane-bound spermidine synthase